MAYNYAVVFFCSWRARKNSESTENFLTWRKRIAKRKDILNAALKALLAGVETSAWLKIPATFISELAALPKDKQKELTGLSQEQFNELLTQSKLTTINWEHKLNELYETGELRKILEDDMQDFIREKNRRNCLLSVSKIANEPVMWAHYAEVHKGAVIGIAFDKLFKVHRVKYPKDRHRPRLNLLHEFTIEKAWEIASTKSASWDYEEEFRSLFDDATLRDLAHQDLTCLRDFNGKKTWFLRLNPASIREVVFGLYTDESLKLAIRKLIERPELQHVKLYQAEESETYTFNLKEWT